MSAPSNAHQFVLLPDWMTVQDFRDLCTKIVRLTDAVAKMEMEMVPGLPATVEEACWRVVKFSNEITDVK